MGQKKHSTLAQRREHHGRWKARGAALNLRKYATPTSLPTEVLTKLAGMKLEPTREAYDQALKNLLQEHHERTCCDD
jgi:hypothetical protein